MSNIDFTPLYDVADKKDYEWMSINESEWLTVIERLMGQGATVEEIKNKVQRRVHVGREPFVLRCEGAARYVMSRRVNG